MTQDVSSLAGSAAFDFSNQTGILTILGAIRAADISLIEKNELKDSVFLFSNGGHDEAVKNMLEKRLAELGVTPDLAQVNKKTEGSSVKVAEVPASGFYGGRPTPVFVNTEPTVVAKMQSPVVSPVVNNPVKSQEDKPIQAEVQKASFVPVRQPVPQPPAQVAPRVILPTTPVKPVDSVNIELKPKDTPVSPNKVNSVPVPSIDKVIPVVASNKTAEDRLERIRFIKSDINGKIGNPVNLVDIDNAIGREYMSALLEAMKLMSSAPAADSEKAMTRLESIYKQVNLLLEVAPQAAAVASKKVPTITPTIPVAAAPRPVVEMKVAPTSNVLPNVDDSESEKITQNFSAAVVNEFAARSKVIERPQATGFAEQPLNIEPSIRKTESPVDPLDSVQDLMDHADDKSDFVRLTTDQALIKEEVEIKPDFISSVASATPLRSVSELPTAAEVSANESKGMDPLYTRDVDDGLGQLLSEWSIFKKSGLFGTGPKGSEHPLYQKISTMQIPLILSGRFEGATQEIKQSITDYMNGWRYEQGIVYEANETFDGYLRRVIRHILDLQNKKRRS